MPDPDLAVTPRSNADSNSAERHDPTGVRLEGVLKGVKAKSKADT